MKWYLKAIQQYADFNGRARRTEYWIFLLINLMITYLSLLIDDSLGLRIGELPYGWTYILYSLILFIPVLSATTRRLHDLNKSGRHIFIILIPVVGIVWLLILLFTDSKAGDNQYGVHPKQADESNLLCKNSTRGLIVLFVVVWFFSSKLLFDFVALGSSELYSTFLWKNIVLPLYEFIWACIPLILAFSLKEKPRQITGFVLGSLYFIYVYFSHVNTLLNPVEIMKFNF